MRTICLSLVIIPGLLLAACSDDAGSNATAHDPATAPVASIDRFADSFGKLFKRSGPGFDPSNVMPVIPAPNAAIDMDRLFLVKSLGPDGSLITYYAFDISSDVPAKAYTFMDQAGAPVADQLPVVSTTPADTGYNDFVRITQIKVKSGYVANSLASASAVEAAVASGDVIATETTTIANWPLVPAGTTATRKFNGRTVTGFRAWYKEQVAHYLRFDDALAATPEGKVPSSPIVVIFKNGMNPAMGFMADPSGQTHNVVATLPGQAGYSSLWIHIVQGNPAGFDSVHDFTSALANQSGPLGVSVNCPVVAP